MSFAQSKYALKRRVYQMMRKRRGLTVNKCADAIGVSTRTWQRRAKKAALGSDKAHQCVVRSIELAFTPPQANAARALHTDG